MNEHKDEMKIALINFRNAAQALSIAWYQYDLDTLYPHIFSYPFEDSFDQVANDIRKWTNELLEAMQTKHTIKLTTTAFHYPEQPEEILGNSDDWRQGK